MRDAESWTSACWWLDTCRHSGGRPTFSADGTTVDVELVDTKTWPLGTAVASVITQLQNYASRPDEDPLLYASAGEARAMSPNGRRVDREPSSALIPVTSLAEEHPRAARLVVEGVHNKTLGQAQRYCREYFGPLVDPPARSILLRAVMLIKFGKRELDGAMPCVTVLYLRDAENNVYVEDVVSLGSAPLRDDDLQVLEVIDPRSRYAPAMRWTCDASAPVASRRRRGRDPSRSLVLHDSRPKSTGDAVSASSVAAQALGSLPGVRDGQLLGVSVAFTVPASDSIQ